MRKLFFFISIVTLSLAVNAATINITPASPHSSNNLRQAIDAAASGDIIEMAAGTYVETGDWLAFTDKEVTVRAAVGAEVIIKPQFSVRVKAPNAPAKAEFIGVQFDCSVLESSELFVPADDKADQKVVLDNCELYDWPENKALIHSTSSRRLDVISINDCYFHGFEKSVVFVENANLVSLSITNSTFADVSASVTNDYWAAPIDVRATTGTMLVDHCTFYNVKAMSSSYGVIMVNNISDVTVSNSIFAQPTSNSALAVKLNGGTVQNSLTYNYTGGTDGIQGETSTTGCITGNPYFVNIESGSYDFSPASFSIAHNAGTDSKNLGDLRWDSNDAAHPTTKNITAGTNAIKAAVEAVWPGDEIVLATGTYNESATIALNKNITIKAAEDATPTVTPANYIAISNGADVTIQDLKIDATSITGHLIDADDATAGNELTLDGCEIYNYTPTSSLIHVGSAKKLDACTINNCYFHNINKSCFFNENTGASNLTITNSTFANITTANSYYAGVIDTRATSGTFLVDHCTFYNVQVINTDYATIGLVKIASGAVVSNCIFAMPTSTADLRAIRDVATANNCLTYNYTKDSNWGIHSSVTKNNCIQLKDPLFTDAANGDFSVLYNWSTGSISPAKGAATDGSDLGDPRWYRDNEVIPSSSITSSYDLLSTTAQLIGDVKLNASSHIEYKGTSTPGTVKWKLHVDRVCVINAVVDREASNISGCQLTLTVKDAEGNTVGTLAATSASYNDNDINLPGTVTFTEAGDYTFVLTNSTSGSASALEKITLSYVGGAVQNIATDANTTLNVADAWFDGCTRDNEKTYIQYPSSGTSSAWIKWNIATSATKYYDVTANVNSDYAHGFTVAIYEDEEAESVASVTEGSYVNTKGASLALELGRLNLVGGKNYVVKVTNAPSGSQAKLLNVVFAPVVATATELPNTLAFSNAVLSEKAFIQDGMLYFNTIGDTDPRGQWAQWEVTTDHDGLFLFTMGVTSSNGQNYKITILDNSENVLDYYETSLGSGDKTIEHYFALETGNYFVKVENTRSYSAGHLTSLVVTEPDDVVTLNEAATDNTSWAAKVGEENTYDVQIIRTIKTGMYNTICLPFALSSSQVRDAFGADVQLRTFDDATIEAGDFVLNLNFEETSGMYQGTPHLIMTSRDIVNPVFTGVKFATASTATSTGTYANFIGNFVKGEIPASENNLFLGANNTLYFPTTNIEILGMRAYFQVHAPAGVSIRRARIIEPDKLPTDIQIVDGEIYPLHEALKIIENGQLIIIRDGLRYNAMGIRVE